MLRRPIRQTQKSGVYIYAVVEGISLGYATVRFANGGARMTNLPVLGGAVMVGEKVVVDYSGGVPPLVRPITTPWEDEAGQLGEGFGESMNEIQSDVSFKVYGDTPQLIGTSYGQVEFATVEWQTEPFFTTGNPKVITLPYDGYYFIYAQLAVRGFEDWRSMLPSLWNDDLAGDKIMAFKQKTGRQRVEAELRGSEVGTFGYQIGESMDMEPTMFTTIDLHGMLPGTEGEEISVWLKHTEPDRDNIDLIVDDTDHLYPRIWGMRLTQGGIADMGAYNYGTTPGTGDPDDPGSGGGGGEDDDSDIEIQTNMGYLHVSDESSSTYARGIANVGDWPALELLLTFRFDEVDASANLRIYLRSTRDWYTSQTPTRGYELVVPNTGGFGLHNVENGVRSLLGSVNYSPSILTHKLRFLADGTTVKAKTWLASESEPGWDLEVVGNFSDFGGLQLGYFNESGDHKIYLDDLDLHVP
jgi:hypothetical protein